MKGDIRAPRNDADSDRSDSETPSPSGDGVSELEALRGRILELDERLIELVGERRRLVVEIGRAKEASGSLIMDPGREAKVVRRAAEIARREGIDQEMVRDVIWRIIASARDEQEGRSNWGPPPSP